jgi:glycine reductase
MRLEIRRAKVRDLAFGECTGLRKALLTVNEEELLEPLRRDRRFAELRLDLARPGERVRILPVKDAVEPRVKIEGGEDYFPGFCAPLGFGAADGYGRAGEGITFALDGAVVLTCGAIVGIQEGFVDMSGPAADLCPFAHTCNVVLTAKPREGLEVRDYEAALRIAGLRLALALAKACRETPPDEVEVFERGTLAEEFRKYPDLPRVAHLCLSITQGLLHDTYVYGADLKSSFPTLLHPNELLDGAVVSGNCVPACDQNTTWHHLKDPVVRELCRRHGTDLLFLGTLMAPESTVLAGKQRGALANAALLEELGADGVVITEEGYGNPDTDICRNAALLERRGIRAVVISDEAAGTDGASQSLADSTPELVAFVSAGNVNERIWVPPMERVIGDASVIGLLSGGDPESLRPDGSILAELQALIGATNEIGFGRSGCRDF